MTDIAPQVSILFVCTGNICRSPTAEAVFRHDAQKAGFANKIMIDSAGTHGYHTGASPDPRSVEAAKTRQYSMEGLKARKLETEDFDRFDLILAMDRGHMDIMREMKLPGSRAALRLLLEFVPNAERIDVPDPYYGGAQGFENVLDLIEAGSRHLLDDLIAEGKVQ